MKRTARLALRNRPLLEEALRPLVDGPAGQAAPGERRAEPPRRPLALELGSGTGEHAVALAGAFPQADWQPSDPDPEARASVAAWAAEARLGNLRRPLDLALGEPAWRRQPCDLLVCVNVLHVAPPEAWRDLLEGAAGRPAGAALLLYGPFSRRGERLPRLERFHRELTGHDARLGVRPLEPLLTHAAALGLRLEVDRAGIEEGDRLLVLRR